MPDKKVIAYIGWTAFFVSIAGYAYFGAGELSKDVSTAEKKRAGGLMASAYIGGAGTATLIVYGLMKLKK
jgi:hypothetical protein